MLTSAIVFDYVWRHFISVFPAAAGLPVAYGEDQEGKDRKAGSVSEHEPQITPIAQIEIRQRQG